MTVNSINGPPMAGPALALPPPRAFSADQKSQVASILSNYDASSLSAEDAREINTAFKEAGFRPGYGLRQAIEGAGFDGETIRSLASPPTERSIQAPPQPNGFVGLNKTNLSELQGILGEYDFEDMASEQVGALLKELVSSGPLMRGSLINIWV